MNLFFNFRYQALIILGVSLTAHSMWAGEPATKMVPRPIPGMAMPTMPAAPRPTQPPAPKSSATVLPTDNPDRARILVIHRRPAQPAAAPVEVQVKEIKGPRPPPPPSEAQPGKVRIIPKAEVPNLLTLDNAEDAEPKPDPTPTSSK